MLICCAPVRNLISAEKLAPLQITMTWIHVEKASWISISLVLGFDKDRRIANAANSEASAVPSSEVPAGGWGCFWRYSTSAILKRDFYSLQDSSAPCAGQSAPTASLPCGPVHKDTPVVVRSLLYLHSDSRHLLLLLAPSK